MNFKKVLFRLPIPDNIHKAIIREMNRRCIELKKKPNQGLYNAVGRLIIDRIILDYETDRGDLRACPFCGKTACIDNFDYDGDLAIASCSCLDCKKEWNETFRLISWGQ